MKKKIVFGLAIMIIGLISACSRYSYYSVGGSQASLSRYRTFAWLPPLKQSRATAYNNDIAQQNIQETGTANLEEKGLVLKGRNPDLLVRYEVMVDNKERVYDQPVYNYVGGYYPRFGGYRGGRGYFYNYGASYPVYVGNDVERVPYKEGTLVIDLIDRKTRKVIWRGYGIGEVDNPAQAVKDLPKVVEGIIKKLPLTAMNKSK